MMELGVGRNRVPEDFLEQSFIYVQEKHTACVPLGFHDPLPSLKPRDTLSLLRADSVYEKLLTVSDIMAEGANDGVVRCKTTTS